jgi:hypothetical protein
MKMHRNKTDPSEKNSSHLVLQPTALLTEIFSCLPQMVTMEEWLSGDRATQQQKLSPVFISTFTISVF